jgi:hypothetical protein
MRATRARARSAALLARMESERPAHASIEVVFRWLARDKEIAGGVLGGGLAYRFFFWVLAITVLAAGGLGFAVPSGVDVDSAAGDVGATTPWRRSVRPQQSNQVPIVGGCSWSALG